ncbi:MAG TPA: hypothetical protein VNW53_11725 [Phenylobacterium sp.]|jgi:hypothetical protein|uniref:hypothetical protein n=1 Tax=Phenylobacterium sp. TaxID=1871053 RepID=UPI002BC4DE6E|nr:hypothetical protein [Phenylobacterium sp.]HXA39662.1 hypothetical protein [Phenylobacterium sp.]
MARRPIGVEFAGTPINGGFVNKRAEIWWALAQWVKGGGALPNDPELVGELTTPTFFFKGDKIQIESKDQIKDRLGRSPDIADALALTFTFPVTPRSVTKGEGRYSRNRGGVRTSAWAA